MEALFERLADNTIDGSIHQICMDWRHMWEMLGAGRSVYSELKEPLRLEQDQRGHGLVLSLKT
jgi:hypothetical protein